MNVITEEILGKHIENELEVQHFFIIAEKVYQEIGFPKIGYSFFLCLGTKVLTIKCLHDLIIARTTHYNSIIRHFEEGKRLYFSCRIKLF